MPTVRNFPGASTTDYLVIPASSVWNFNTNICVMMFLYIDSVGASGANLCFFGAEWTRGFWTKLNDDRTLTFGKTPSSFPTSTITLPLNTWCGIALMSTTGGNAHFYIWNATTEHFQKETISNAGAIVATSASDVGRISQWISAVSDEALDGRIQRVVVSQGYPTDAEFEKWCKYGSLPTSATVKGAWKLMGNSPELDLSGNGNNLTVTGTTTSENGFTYDRNGFKRTPPPLSSFQRRA